MAKYSKLSRALPSSSEQVTASSRQDVPPPVRCAENIALLELLDPRPDDPKFPALQQPLADSRADVQRSLSLNHERELATNLAFLAAISDDFKHVMAVCIEEVPELGACQVLVAINKKTSTSGKDTTSGDDILNKVQRGFQQIFGRLREISPGESEICPYLGSLYIADIGLSTP